MTKMHRVILIDPEARRVSEVECRATLADLHEMIGTDAISHFRLALFADGHVDVGWLDDAGLSRGAPIHAFLLPMARDPMAGKCVIVGADRFGETCGAMIPLAILRQDISWLGVILPEVTWDHTEEGSRAIVTYSRVKE